MRLGWAVVAGALGAGVLAWWLAREPSPGSAPDRGATTPSDARGGQVLYRWRDADGVMQVTDTPPAGREYTVVDVAALERRNTIDPNPALEAEREQ
jgi:hypothetical protein